MMRKTVTLLFLFCIVVFPLFAQDSLPLLKKVVLSQEEEFIALAYDFAVTKEEYIFLNDLKGQKIMLYDRNGQFIKSWKMRGQGPGEYQGAFKINFMEPYLGILDFAALKLVIYRWDNSQELEWVKNIQSPSLWFSNFQFYKDIVIFIQSGMECLRS